MIPEYFALIGAAIASIGGVQYLYLTIVGKVKPNKVTWFFWAAFPMIAFAAQLSQGVGIIAWATFSAGAPPLFILLASFANKDAYWELRKIDYTFAALAIVGVVLWQVTNSPNIALTFAIFADLAAALPTVIKAYKNPETEDWQPFAIGTFGFVFALLSVQIWSYENYAFVVYVCLINAAIALLAARKPSPIQPGTQMGI